MGTLIMTTILCALIITLMYRTIMAYNIDIYISINHTRLHEYIPEIHEIIFSIKPLTEEYWLNECIKKYAESNQE